MLRQEQAGGDWGGVVVAGFFETIVTGLNGAIFFCTCNILAITLQ
jgi:hypothetical protein